MKDIDFVKKCCEYTKDCYCDDTILVCNTDHYTMAVVIEEGVLTPLHRDMMQQAIEGINEKYKNAEDEYPIIEIDCFDITVWFVAENITEIFYFDKYDSINAAKRAALEYIFEKMGE